MDTPTYRRIDGQTGIHADEQMKDRQTARHTDRQMDVRKEGHMSRVGDGQMDG